MKPFPIDVPNADLIAFIDEWAAHMERRDFSAAYAHTDHLPSMPWSPDLLRQSIKNYADGGDGQNVTIAGRPDDGHQVRQVDRWELNGRGEVGEIWYDLNIDGVKSDLTVTFQLVQVPEGISVRLSDIRVM